MIRSRDIRAAEATAARLRSERAARIAGGGLVSVPIDEEDRFFYVSPATHISILKMDKFTRSNYVGDAAAQRAVNKARVGEVYNAPVYRSSLANNNPSTANTSYSWFAQKQAVALIIQRKPVTHVDRIILEDGWGVLTTCIYQFVERLIAPSTLGGGSSDDRFACGVRGA